jgi:hypothetical protein
MTARVHVTFSGDKTGGQNALLALTAVPLSRDVHAAELDCETDDTEALRRAFRAVGPAGKIVVPAGGRLRVASTVTANPGGG